MSSSRTQRSSTCRCSERRSPRSAGGILVHGLVLALLALLAGAQPVRAADVNLNGVAGGPYSLRVTSLKELRFKRAFARTVHQQFDFSCGSAAVATLLTHHYRYSVSEAYVFQWMYEKGDQEKIRAVGFSMLDMKRFLEDNGFHADGFEAGVAQIAAAGVPAIVLLQDKGYNHFVVVKGVRGDKVLVGDPAVGIRTFSREDFEARWPSRIAFVITNKTEWAAFNAVADWNHRPELPLGTAIGRESLAAVTLLRPSGRDF